MDMKDKPKAGLIINWLGGEAAQVLKSMEVEAGKPDEVFEALEKIFRLESNQTLARFGFRSMKQTQHQSIDNYMSKLRLALPECKYKNDSDELLKDQFVFGVPNKEIQDHLLGEKGKSSESQKSRIAQLLEKYVIIAVVRTTLRTYSNLINLDQAAGVDQMEIGHAGPRVHVPIDVSRYRVYFIIEKFGTPRAK